MENLKHELFKSLDVPTMYITSLTFVAIQETLGTIAMTITIVYTCWKWYKEIKHYKNKPNDN